METIQLIYNEINKDGRYKSVYFDTRGLRDNDGFFIKIIENGQMKLFEITRDQVQEMYQIIDGFIKEIQSYRYKNFDSSLTDFTLVVTIISAGRVDKLEQQNGYYNWQTSSSIPKGVEMLLEFFNKNCSILQISTDKTIYNITEPIKITIMNHSNKSIKFGDPTLGLKFINVQTEEIFESHDIAPAVVFKIDPNDSSKTTIEAAEMGINEGNYKIMVKPLDDIFQKSSVITINK
jgi:hypothetical protein